MEGRGALSTSQTPVPGSEPGTQPGMQPGGGCEQGLGTGEAPPAEAAIAERLCLQTRYLRACSVDDEGLQEQQSLQQGLIPAASLH